MTQQELADLIDGLCAPRSGDLPHIVEDTLNNNFRKNEDARKIFIEVTIGKEKK